RCDVQKRAARPKTVVIAIVCDDTCRSSSPSDDLERLVRVVRITIKENVIVSRSECPRQSERARQRLRLLQRAHIRFLPRVGDFVVEPAWLFFKRKRAGEHRRALGIQGRVAPAVLCRERHRCQGNYNHKTHYSGYATHETTQTFCHACLLSIVENH